jgi:hypothetical protein
MNVKKTAGENVGDTRGRDPVSGMGHGTANGAQPAESNDDSRIPRVVLRACPADSIPGPIATQAKNIKEFKSDLLKN